MTAQTAAAVCVDATGAAPGAATRNLSQDEQLARARRRADRKERS